MKIIDAMGDVCPVPVVKTKKAIMELTEGDVVETLVDNEIAVQNLTRMAQQKHFPVKSEKISDGEYRVFITVDKAPDQGELDDIDESLYTPQGYVGPAGKNKVVAISSDTMGRGDDKLGAVLIKSFIYALSQQDTLPSTILFYNGGAKLTCENEAVIEDLKNMQEQGVEIMTCGTCLNHYGLTEKLQVGTVTNMYDIVEKLMTADLVIKP